MKKSPPNHCKTQITQKTQKTQRVKSRLKNAEKKNTLLFLKRFFFYAAAILMSIGGIHALVECIIIDQNPANSAPGWVAFLLYLPIYAIFALLLCGVGAVFNILSKREKGTEKSKVGKTSMTYGEKIYTLRERNGMSQEELAERLDVSRQTISNWENDKVKIDIIKAKQLCDIFQISIEEFCKDEISVETAISPQTTANTEEKAQNTIGASCVSSKETNGKTEKNTSLRKILPWVLLGCTLIFVVIAVVDTVKTGTLTVGSIIQIKSSWWMLAFVALVACAILFYQNKKKK